MVSVSLGGSRFEAGGKESFPFVGGDDEPREESTTQSSNTAWPLQANDATSVASRTDDSVAASIGTAPLIRGNVTDGSPVSSPPSGSLSVKTDKADYAPGSTATFTATGVMTGSSVTFQIADLTSAPGANGIADVYTPFRVKDGGAGDLDGLANGTVVANWLVPADGRATGAELQLSAISNGHTASTTFSDAANKIATENQLAGTPESVWSIHGSIANAGDSQIEGFATQISNQRGTNRLFQD